MSWHASPGVAEAKHKVEDLTKSVAGIETTIQQQLDRFVHGGSSHVLQPCDIAGCHSMAEQQQLIEAATQRNAELLKAACEAEALVVAETENAAGAHADCAKYEAEVAAAQKTHEQRCAKTAAQQADAEHLRAEGDRILATATILDECATALQDFKEHSAEAGSAKSQLEHTVQVRVCVWRL